MRESSLKVELPRTRYRRIGELSSDPLPPIVDRTARTVTIFFPRSPSLAYLIGAIIGDGSVTNRRLSFYNSDIELLELIATELTLVARIPHVVPRILAPGVRGTSSIEFADSALARLIAALRAERLFELVGSTTLFGAFLAGLLDSDGSAGLYKNTHHPNGTPQISICNSNLQLLEFIDARLKTLNIDGRISLARKPRTTMINGRSVAGKKPVYRLVFYAWSSTTTFSRLTLPYVKSQKKRKRLIMILQAIRTRAR